MWSPLYALPVLLPPSILTETFSSKSNDCFVVELVQPYSVIKSATDFVAV